MWFLRKKIDIWKSFIQKMWIWKIDSCQFGYDWQFFYENAISPMSDIRCYKSKFLFKDLDDYYHLKVLIDIFRSMYTSYRPLKLPKNNYILKVNYHFSKI